VGAARAADPFCNRIAAVKLFSTGLLLNTGLRRPNPIARHAGIHRRAMTILLSIGNASP
jgi:hypothetical protein